MTTTVFTTILVALITAVFGPIIVNWVKLKMEKKSLLPQCLMLLKLQL
jgi:hypothetical protein